MGGGRDPVRASGTPGPARCVHPYVVGTDAIATGKDLKSQTLRSLTELLNAVAPPIAEHEVIKVSLSHDMIGYDGVETLVYRGLAKVRSSFAFRSRRADRGRRSWTRLRVEP